MSALIATLVSVALLVAGVQSQVSTCGNFAQNGITVYKLSGDGPLAASTAVCPEKKCFMSVVMSGSVSSCTIDIRSINGTETSTSCPYAAPGLITATGHGAASGQLHANTNSTTVVGTWNMNKNTDGSAGIVYSFTSGSYSGVCSGFYTWYIGELMSGGSS